MKFKRWMNKMATTFEFVSLAGLRKAHLRQLLYYIEHDDGEWYYGPRDQFEKRHKDLKEWVQNMVDYAYSDGVVMPKKG